MAPSRHDWKIVDWDVKPQHNTSAYKIDQIMSVHSQNIISIKSHNFVNRTIGVVHTRYPLSIHFGGDGWTDG